MSCGAAGHLAGFLVRTFKDQASQRDPLPVDLPTIPTTLEHQCAWLDRLAFPVSDILDIPARPPLSTPTSNPLQCSWAEQLSFVNWNASPPVVETLSSQPQSKWLHPLASFDLCGTEPPSFTGPEEIAGSVAPFNIFVLVVVVVALMAHLKLSRWVWRCREELAPYLFIITLLATREASLAMVPIHVIYHCGVSSTPYFCSIVSWGLRHLLLLRDPISHNDYQILLDRVDSLTKSLAITNAAQATAEKDHHEAATTSATRITNLEDLLSKEQSKVTELTVESKKASSEMETLTAKKHSLTITTNELTGDITKVREEQESKARTHHAALEQHTLEILEHKAALQSATKRAEELTDDIEAKATQIEVLNTRIANMQHDFDTSCKEQATAASQLSDSADKLALERQSLAAENNVIRADNTELQRQLATLVEEKTTYVEDLNARTTEAAELRAALTVEKDQHDRHVEQAEAEAAEIVQLRSTISSLRHELAAANARPLNLNDCEAPLHLVEAQSSEIVEPEDAMVAENADGVDDASRTGSLLESQKPTNVFVGSPAPYTEVVTAADYVVTTVDVPVPADQLSSTELNDSSLNGVESYVVQKTESQNTSFGEEHELPTLILAALPMSPPVTPPGTSTDLFASPSTTGIALELEATPINCATLNASLDSASLADVPATSSPPDPALNVEFPPVEPSHAGPAPSCRTNTRGPRSFLNSALRATNTRGDVPPLPRAAPTATPAANAKPHSWDVPAGRVYPPGSDNNPVGGRSATQRKHNGPKLAKYFHREKGPRPSRSGADQ